MKQIEFFKNNEKIDINQNKIIFDNKNLTITKNNEDYEIFLDFKNKECNFTLKTENITFPIDIIKMNHYNHKNKLIFNYELTSEENVKNTIKISL